jgi:glycosyltransferase involved in cell wall biosynthesis
VNRPVRDAIASMRRRRDRAAMPADADAMFADTVPCARELPPPATPGRALHVAIVTETFPPEVNGVAATVARVVEGLLAQGHMLQLVRLRQPGASSPRDEAACGTPPGAGTLTERLLPGLAVPRYPDLRMGLPATGTLTRLWQRQLPDVVHLVTEGPLGWSALRAARRLALPVVSDFRTNFHAYSRHYGAAWLHDPIASYLRRFHNRTACTMVPTAQLRDTLAAQGFERLRVVARGVDARHFHPVRRDEALRAGWGASPEAPVAMCVGRLAPEKDLDTVIDAFRALRATRPDARLVLVGDGPDRARLEARCPEAVFAGVQRGEALAAHYASADLFLFASTTETYGNVVPEAMASALAVLAYDHAAAGELVRHGHNGLIAPPCDREAFLRLAVRLGSEPGLARRLGIQARRTAQALDWQRIVDAIELEYRAAIDRPPQPARAAVTRWGRPGWHLSR